MLAPLDPQLAVLWPKSSNVMARGRSSARPWPRRQPKAVELTDGQVLAADVVVLAIGVRPETGLARAAGLSIGRGVDPRR